MTEWQSYQRLVLSELEHHGKALDDIKKQIVKVEIELATLKIRAGFWGAMGASIPAIGIALFELLKK